MKPNCFKCKFKREIPGNAHIRCEHPLNTLALKSPLLEMIALYGLDESDYLLNCFPKELNIKADPKGIKRGLFYDSYQYLKTAYKIWGLP